MLRDLFGRAGVTGALGALLALAFIAAPAAAQEGAITGTVVDGQTLEPLNGAQVFIPGTEFGTLTDREGRYRLTGVPTGQVELQARLIGFRRQSRTVTVQAGQAATVDFELPVSAVQLEDVTVNVVTGLERRRLEVGTNVGEINAAEINKGAITDFADLLAGRSEGVIMQDMSGTTGTAQRIRIRGASSLSLDNDPLIIVDGVYFSNATDLDAGFTGGQEPSRLNDLNPDDIQSIEVVKGPSAAALYGAVGANGVIIIQTKRGEAGGTDWRFYAEGGTLEDITDWPANFEAVQAIGSAGAPVFTEDGFNDTDYAPCPNVSAAAGDCTQDQFLVFDMLEDPRTTPFQTGSSQSYGMNVSGGSTDATYFLSGELKAEDGVARFDFNTEDKISGRVNLDAGLLDNLSASLSVGYVDREVGFLNNDNSIFSPLINGLCGKAGFVPGEADNGGPNPQNFCFFRNMQDLGEASLSTQETDRFTASVNGNWQPLAWLTAQGTFGVDLSSSFEHVTIQPGLDNLASDWVDGFREASRPERYNYTANASVSGTFDLTENISSTSTAGAQYQEELLNGVSCFGAGLVQGTASCESTSLRFSVDEDYLNVIQLGAFFQQEFSWRDRLFLTGSVRLDDNSNFGGEVPMQVYPSANVSYLVSAEDWFPTDGPISELRLRGAYGEAGVLPGFNDAITLFAPITATFRGASEPGLTLDETGNPELEPERSREFEGGFDLGLLQDRLGLGLTYFHKTSVDALIEREIPPSFGLTTDFFQNLGEIRNQGFEASLRALALDMEEARANFTLQFTSLDNEIVELGEGVEPITFDPQRHQEGFPAGSYFQQPYTFEDANGDGLIGIDEVTLVEAPDVSGLSDEEARRVLGDFLFMDEALPTWTASLSADLELFQFLRFNTLLDARGGNSQENFTEAFRCRQFLQSGVGCEATGGQNASLEDQARFVAYRFYGSEHGYIEDATFLKWRELSVTLTAPPSIADVHPLLERSSFTLSGRNLATWTEYGGIDPEISFAGASANFTQAEFNTQPPVRYFVARLDIRF